MTLIDKACTILEKTNDGSNLTPQHLKLIENAVNGFLNEEDLKAFDELYKSVAGGKYQRPDYLGVEFMDRDQEGYVYFKGQSVEHYSAFYAYSYSAQADLKVLQSKCLYLEQIKQPVKRHMQCDWEMGGEFAEGYCKAQKEKLDKAANGNTLIFSTVNMGAVDKFVLSGHPPAYRVMESRLYRENCEFRHCNNRNFTVTAYSYGSGAYREAAADELVLIQSCFDYLKDKEFIREQSSETRNFDNQQTGITHQPPDEEEADEACEI